MTVKNMNKTIISEIKKLGYKITKEENGYYRIESKRFNKALGWLLFDLLRKSNIEIIRVISMVLTVKQYEVSE